MNPFRGQQNPGYGNDPNAAQLPPQQPPPGYASQQGYAPQAGYPAQPAYGAAGVQGAAPPVPPAPSQSEIHGDQLKGKSVIDRTGTDFGQVADIALDPQSWRVTGIVVDVRREVAERLHLNKPLMGNARLVVGADRVENVGDHVMLNLTAADMGAMLGRMGP